MPIFSILLATFATHLISHALIVMRLWAGFEWLSAHPDAFFITALLTFMTTLVFFLISKSARFAIAIVNGPILVLSFISFLKCRQFGMPLFPWDFSLTHEFAAVVPGFFQSSTAYAMGFVAVLILGGILYSRFPRGSLNWNPTARWSTLGLLTAFLAVTFLANNPYHEFLFHRHFQVEASRPKDGIRDNGMLIAFIVLKELGEIYTPPGYDNRIFQELVAGETRVPANALPPAKETRPDVVVVMSESLFDPTLLEGVRWKSDPLAFTRSLAPGRPLSLSVVPTFGGRTGNSEFEFLTGFSTSFFAKGTIPYVRLIDSPEPSMARAFHQAGYKTVTIHPGDRDSYNRAHVYPELGFDESLFAENMNSPQRYGNQISDESILPVLRDSMNRISGPSFHFIVTIQNHWPYNPNPFDLKDPPFENENLSKDEQVVLNYYGKLLAATDRFHRELVNYLQSRKRPVVLVIFGDHLPPLLPEFAPFRGRMVRSANPENWSPPEKLRMFTTPYVQWSNFPLAPEDRPTQTSFLGMHLLRKLGLPMTAFQNFVAKMGDRHPVFKRDFLEKPEVSMDEDINRYWIFQYGTFTHREVLESQDSFAAHETLSEAPAN